MKKIFHLVQWAVVIALVLFSIRMLARPVPPPDRRPDTWSNWSGFHALSFAGITRKPTAGCLTRAQLQEHLAALAGAGYHTIFPEDALAFLEGRHPLPERAVLLLFEGGRKDSYVHATPLLRRTGAVATLLAPTAKVESWNTFFLRPRDLRKIARDPHWRLASMGHKAVETSTAANGEPTRYLSQRLPQPDGHVESDEAYRARVLADVAEASHRLRAVGAPEDMAFLLPYADDGTGPGADPLAAGTIAESIAVFHRLAFTRADESFNGPDRNPLQASRIRVPSDWDARQLLAALDSSSPRTSDVTQADDPSAWSLQGPAAFSNGCLRLEPGAQAWVRGSGAWSDVNVTVALQPGPGGAGLLFLRHAGPDNYLRLRVHADGVALQEKFGGRVQTLAAWSNVTASAVATTYTIRLRGNRLWVLEDERERAGPLPLTRVTVRGRVGVEAEQSSLTVSRFEVHLAPGVVALARNGFQAWSEADRLNVRSIVIPWFEASQPPTLRDEQREDVLQAAALGMDVVPRIDGGQNLTPDQAQMYVSALAQALDHIMTRTLVRRFAVTASEDTLAAALHDHGYGVVRVLEEKDLAALTPQATTLNPGDAWVILMNNPAAATGLTAWPAFLPTHRLALEYPREKTLPAGVSPVIRFNL